MPRIIRTLAWLLLLLPAVTWAASGTTAQSYLVSINRLYESLEYEQALEQIHLARQGPRSTEEEVTLFIYEGILLLELGQQEQGTAAFESALLLQPKAKLPVRVSPKISQFFESMQQKVKRKLAAVPSASPVQPPTAASDPAPQGMDLRRYSLLPAIAGGTLMAAGGVSWALSRTELNRLRNDDPKLTTQADVQRAISRGRTWQTVGISLLSVGLVGVAAAAGLYTVGTPSTSGVLAVGTDGTSALVYGRWP